MWTAGELTNFSRYLQSTPRHLWGQSAPLGAYDSARGARDHVGNRRLEQRDFSRGGAFDATLDEPESGKGDAVALLKHLASRLSPQEWSELQGVLCAGDDGETAEDGTPEYKENKLPKNGLEVAEDAALAVGAGRIRNAHGLAITTDVKAVRQHALDVASRIKTYA
jgi:hypothetical protein